MQLNCAGDVARLLETSSQARAPRRRCATHRARKAPCSKRSAAWRCSRAVRTPAAARTGPCIPRMRRTSRRCARAAAIRWPSTATGSWPAMPSHPRASRSCRGTETRLPSGHPPVQHPAHRHPCPARSPTRGRSPDHCLVAGLLQQRHRAAAQHVVNPLGGCRTHRVASAWRDGIVAFRKAGHSSRSSQSAST